MPKYILLADDCSDDIEALQITFKKVGVGNPFRIVKSGEEAISYFKGEGAFKNRDEFPLPHILLLDLKMPGMDGFHVLEWLGEQKEFKKLLIVVLSGHQGLHEVKRAYNLGANSFLFKPCSPEDIANLMKSFREYWTPLLTQDAPDHADPPLPMNSANSWEQAAKPITMK
jgi:CheY-like chemotaxis protein